MILLYFILLLQTIFYITISHIITVDCGKCFKKDCFTNKCITFTSQYGYIKQQICADFLLLCPEEFPVKIYSRQCQITKYKPGFFTVEDDDIFDDDQQYDCPTKCCIDDNANFLDQVCVYNPQFQGYHLCQQMPFYMRKTTIIIIICFIILGITFLYVYTKQKNKELTQTLNPDNDAEGRQMTQSYSESQEKSSSYQSRSMLESKQSITQSKDMRQPNQNIKHGQMSYTK